MADNGANARGKPTFRIWLAWFYTYGGIQMKSDEVIKRLKDYLSRSLKHFQELNTSKDPATVAYGGHKADLIFEIQNKIKEWENE